MRACVCLPLFFVSFPAYDPLSCVLKVARHAQVTEAPEDGCYVRGLFIEAARWDKETKSLQPSGVGLPRCTYPQLLSFGTHGRTSCPPDDF